MKEKIIIGVVLILSLIGGYYYAYTKDNKELKEIQLNINLEAETLGYKISSEEVKQGDYIKLTIENIGNSKLRIESNIASTISNEIYINGDNGYCYIPVALAKTTGSYVINIFNDTILVKTYSVKIIAGEFATQKLTISQDIINSTATKEANDQYNEAVAKARSYNIKEKLFEDNFILPVEGEITTEFGMKRYTNNDPTPTRHYGIDIASDKGTIVKATASGKVVFAGRLISSGNFIVIDHGMGILSYYSHMDSLNVKEMDIVKQGDTVGFVGTTGYSTGPHLHFNLTLKDTTTNPWQFIKK